MAEFLVRHTLNPYKVIKLGISFSQLINKGNKDGELIWVVEIGTNEPHKNGGSINPVYLNKVTFETFDAEVDKAVAFISEQIDWGVLLEDNNAPYVDSYSPSASTVPLQTPIRVVLKELLPSSGIDISTIKLSVNDMDVTNELHIEGNPYEYVVQWMPTVVVPAEYGATS